MSSIELGVKERNERLNKNLMTGYLIGVAIVFVAYLVDCVRGGSSLAYFVTFAILDIVPSLLVIYVYSKNKANTRLKYFAIAAFMVMYTFVMFTGETTLVFSYILPFLSLLILYHRPKLILCAGMLAIILNVIQIYIRFLMETIDPGHFDNVEIQIIIVCICVYSSYISTVLYNEIHLKNNKYIKELDNANDEVKGMAVSTVTTIANIIDAKDSYTRGHSKRVSEYAGLIAEKMGMDAMEVDKIKIIGLLHDIGKIGIPDAVLNKPGRLTDEEFAIMKNHTVIGNNILKDMSILDDLDLGAKYHHERFDGKGYPDGLTGKSIPLIARIIAVADAYDAMTSDRVYRKKLSEEAVLEQLRKGSGTQWDPECANIMIELIENGEIPKFDGAITSNDAELNRGKSGDAYIYYKNKRAEAMRWMKFNPNDTKTYPPFNTKVIVSYNIIGYNAPDTNTDDFVLKSKHPDDLIINPQDVYWDGAVDTSPVVKTKNGEMPTVFISAWMRYPKV